MKTGFSDAEIISDESSLKKYLSEQEILSNTENPRFAQSAEYMTNMQPQFIHEESSPIPRYRTAYRSSPLVQSAGNKSFLTDSSQIYVKLGIHAYMETWTERMRKWLSKMIVKRVVVLIENVEKLQPLPTQNFSSSLNFPSSKPSDSLWYNISTPAPPSTNELLQRLAQDPAQKPDIIKRIKYDKYLNVIGSTSREYVIKRIQELAQGAYLSAFKWNGGGVWKGKEWTPELPTDSQILIHLFCTYMDFLLLQDPLSEIKPFTYKYFICFPDTPEGKSSSVLIHQSHIHPPDFEVVYAKEKWRPDQGRNNLFHTLIFFIHCIAQKFDGYIDQVNMDGAEPQLQFIFSGQWKSK
eukprot:TRINITY_DN1845_c0_g1_i2.p1 TRINITY_DN1845_c0_g1~~TRINITY_DN1845_c0_g1_i2.p1  ORF type:complete len:352 (+),score=76.72 TRINITY_DN1845_c0_g1_i2:784-1839(+)